MNPANEYSSLHRLAVSRATDVVDNFVQEEVEDQTPIKRDGDPFKPTVSTTT